MGLSARRFLNSAPTTAESSVTHPHCWTGRRRATASYGHSMRTKFQTHWRLWIYWSSSKRGCASSIDWLSRLLRPQAPGVRRRQGRAAFREDLSRVLARNEILVRDGRGRRHGPDGPPELTEVLRNATFETGDDILDQLLENARAKFTDPSLKVRKEALEKIRTAISHRARRPASAQSAGRALAGPGCDTDHGSSPRRCRQKLPIGRGSGCIANRLQRREGLRSDTASSRRSVCRCPRSLMGIVDPSVVVCHLR